MSRSGRSPRAALSRALVLLLLVCGTLLGAAGAAMAAVNGVNPTAPDTTVSSGPAAAGVSFGTLTWAVVGFALLVLGFVAASRTGRRDLAATRPSPMSAGAVRFFQAPTQEASSEPTSAMTV